MLLYPLDPFDVDVVRFGPGPTMLPTRHRPHRLCQQACQCTKRARLADDLFGNWLLPLDHETEDRLTMPQQEPRRKPSCGARSFVDGILDAITTGVICNATAEKQQQKQRTDNGNKPTPICRRKSTAASNRQVARTSAERELTLADDRMQVCLSVAGFAPDELSVRVKDDERTLIIEGRHEARSDDGSAFVLRSFRRQFAVPPEHRLDAVQTRLNAADGTLCVCVPREQPKPVEQGTEKGEEGRRLNITVEAQEQNQVESAANSTSAGDVNEKQPQEKSTRKCVVLQDVTVL